jgi:hypothetical protein
MSELKFSELFSKTKASYLNRMERQELQDEIFDPEISRTENNKYLSAVKTSLTKMTKLKTGVNEITYKPAKGRIGGRLFANGGMQNMSVNIRNFLLDDLCKDIDMCNCHPTIAEYLAKKEGVETPYLTDYNLNRSSILQREGLTKKKIVTMMNCDSSKGRTPWAIGFLSEIETIKNIIYEKNKGDLLATYKKNNMKSSVFNYHICVIENECLQRAIAIIDPLNIHVLCFDGLLMNKSATLDIPALNLATEEYGLKWVEKPLYTTLKIPADYISVDSAWDADKQLLEKQFCIIKDPQCIAHEVPHGTILLPISNLGFMAAPYFNDEFKLKDWLRCNDRRIYDKLDFVPYATGQEDSSLDNIYNTFRPFTSSVVDYDLEDVQPFIDHVHINICGKNSEASEWLIKLLAWRLQNPDKLPEVAVILKGLPGAGKDRLMDIMERIMGSDNNYIYRTEKMNDLFGDFNGALKNKLIVQINEAKGADGCKWKESLKQTITSHNNNINEKGLRQYILTNYALIIVCSNNLTPIVIEIGDRRYVLIRTGRTNIGNEPYWRMLSELMDSPIWISQVFSYLINVDLSGFEPSSLAGQPKTQEYKDAQLSAISPVYKCLRDLPYDDMETIGKGKYKGLYYIRNNDFSTRVMIENDDKPKSSELINKLLRDVDGIIVNRKVSLAGDKQVYHLFDRPVVENDVNNRIFKNIEKEEEIFID